jgi:hypothetical protein
MEILHWPEEMARRAIQTVTAAEYVQAKAA